MRWPRRRRRSWGARRGAAAPGGRGGVPVGARAGDAAVLGLCGGRGGFAPGLGRAYRQRFPSLRRGKPMIVEAVSVEAIAGGDAPREPMLAEHPPRAVPRRETVR